MLGAVQGVVKGKLVSKALMFSLGTALQYAHSRTLTTEY
jgi:hypothetical protein